MNEKAGAPTAGREETEYGDAYVMTQPRFETGDPRCAWLDRIVAVAEGAGPWRRGAPVRRGRPGFEGGRP